MAVTVEERGGGKAWTCPPPSFALSPAHTRPFLSRPPGVSLVKSPAIYLCDWSGRGIYTRHGSVKSGHKFQNFQTGHTYRDSEWDGPCDRGEPGFGQTAESTLSKQELLSFENKNTVKKRKRQNHCGPFLGNILHHNFVCFLFLPRPLPPLRSRCFALGFVLQIHQIPLLIFPFVI